MSLLSSILRQRISRQHQCFQHFNILTRSYCYKPEYKPVERKIFAAKEQSNFKELKIKIYSTEEKKIKRNSRKPNTDHERSLKIVQALPANPQNYSKDDLIEAFNLLGMLPASDDALVHDNFIALIEATKLILPKLSTAQCVLIFSQMSCARISMYDDLSEHVANHLLDHVVHNIVTSKKNEDLLTINDILLIDLTLRKYYWQNRLKLSRLFDYLRQSNCNLFVKKMNNIEDISSSISHRELMQCMRYLSNNSSVMNMFDSKCLFKKLLAVNDDEYKLEDTEIVLATMSRFEKLNEHAKPLIEKMFRIWCNVADTDNDVVDFLYLLAYKKSEKCDFTEFRNAAFNDRCTQILTRTNKMYKMIYALEYSVKLNFVDTKLIDAISLGFDNGDHKGLKGRDYREFFTACFVINYKPSNWESSIVPEAMEIRIDKYDIKLASILHKMRIPHKDLPQFSDAIGMQCEYENLLGKRVASNKTMNSILLTCDCEKFVGSNNMLYNVIVNNELTVPILLKVNTKTGDFEDMQNKSLDENLACNENEMVVAVLTQDIGSAEDDFDKMSAILNKHRELIKKRGWIGITLDLSLYGSMETYKRAFTFFKLILYAINNRQNNERN